jgi:hypothetical protein
VHNAWCVVCVVLHLLFWSSWLWTMSCRHRASSFEPPILHRTPDLYSSVLVVAYQRCYVPKLAYRKSTHALRRWVGYIKNQRFLMYPTQYRRIIKEIENNLWKTRQTGQTKKNFGNCWNHWKKGCNSVAISCAG